ncbi:HET domain-containing protein [Trichoderma ceciliae]
MFSIPGESGHEFMVLDQPCKHCKVLEFDDLGHGATIRCTSNGRRYLDFGEIQGTRTMRQGDFIKRKVRGIGIDPNELTTYQKTELKLGYRREDVLPGLPSFAATGSQGCAFCDILRRDIISVWNDIKISKGTDDDADANLDADPDEHAKDCEASVTITEVNYQLQDQNKNDYMYEAEHGIAEPKTWLDSLYVFFSVFFKKENKEKDYSLHYSFHTDASDECAPWFNLWRRHVPGELLSPLLVQRSVELVDKSTRKIPASAHYLPTRLLDVGSSSSPDLRLVVTKQHPPLVGAIDAAMKRYVALSYCWGPKEDAERQLKTTASTIKDHLLQIDITAVPQTIADAISVCRAIGIRYLWVDALCIIQGDAEDWSKESFEMSNVYSNSFVTFCVLQGTSCLSGFLKRKVRRTLQINFRSRLDDSVSGKLSLQMLEPPESNLGTPSAFLGNSSNIVDDLIEKDIDSAVWSERGWTFQEAQLSPRKLFFGNLTVSISAGDFRESADGASFGDDSFPVNTRKAPKDALNGWYRLVGKFVRRKLSYEQDRFPAMSALTRAMSDLYPDLRYLAGLWIEDLHRGLLWTTNAWRDFEDFVKPHDQGYIAPSWSWACRPYMITWLFGVGLDGHSFTSEFELRDTNVVTEKFNPYGRVFSGYLDLHAKLFKLPLGSDGRALVKQGSMDWLGIIFHYLLQSDDGEYIAHLHLDWDNCGVLHTYGYPKGPIHEFWMTLISSTNLNSASMSSRPFLTDSEIVVGLLLLPTENEHEFTKLGVWYSENRGRGGRKFWENIQPQSVRLV